MTLSPYRLRPASMRSPASVSLGKAKRQGCAYNESRLFTTTPKSKPEPKPAKIRAVSYEAAVDQFVQTHAVV
jgi:hypothetical protein